MRIQHNIPAMGAYRNYVANNSLLSKNLEKLSSGYKINRAGDNAAGLAISEKMRAQISGLSAAQNNAKDGISLVQTAEGALTEVHDMLNRMVTLAEQSSNGTYGDDLDREQLQKEVDQLRTEINRIADSANFNGIKLLDGSMDVSNAREATSETLFHTSIGVMKSLEAKDIAPNQNGSTTGKYVDGDLGIHTIRHKEANAEDKGGFYVDLNNYTVKDSGTLTIAIGSVGGTVGSIAISIGSNEVASGKTVSAAQLAKKAVEAVRESHKAELVSAGEIASTVAASTVDPIIKVNNKEYTVSADGNRIKFESVDGKSESVAKEVRILAGSAASTAYNYEVNSYAEGSGTGSITKSEIQFTFDSSAPDALKAGFVGAGEKSNVASFTFEVGLAQQLGTISGTIAANQDINTKVKFAATNSDASIVSDVAGFKITAVSGHTVATSTLNDLEIKVTDTVTNTSGTADKDGSVSFYIKLGDIDTKESGISSAASATYTSSNVAAAIKGKIDAITDAIATDGVFTIGVVDVASTQLGGAAVTATTDKVSFGAGATDTTTIDFTFDVGEGANAAKITVALSLSELRTAAGNGHDIDTSFTMGVVRDALTKKVKDLFGKQVEDPDADMSKDKMTIQVGSDVISALGSGFELKASVYNEGAAATRALTATELGSALAIGTEDGQLQVSNSGVVTLEVWSKGDDGVKIGTFTVTPGANVEAEASNAPTFYKASDAYASAVGDKGSNAITIEAGYNTTKSALGTGDYNTSTEAIKPGADQAGTRLASTKFNAKSNDSTMSVQYTTLDNSGAATLATATLNPIFSGKIKDGAVMRIGETNYIFAVGADSKLEQDVDGNILVDLKDIDNDKDGLTGADLETALERLTVAAKDNAMFGVGYDKTTGEFTLTENADYYSEGKVLLDSEAMIASQIAFGNITADNQTSETVETEAFAAKNLTLQIGDTSDSYNQLELSIKDMHTDAIGIGTIDISTQQGAQEAVDKIKAAINYVSDVRGGLGATQNRLEHTINNLSVMVENITDAESTIRDTDIAEEMMAYTKNSILNQAAQAMLAQANQLPQGVLQLLG